MPRETTTTQCYPSDEVVNRTVSAWETWGWELISNQRCQEYTHQDADGTKHYETFNKLTFSRDKDAKWYKQVVALEREYDEAKSEINRLKHSRPKAPVNQYTTANPIIALVLFCFYIIPGVIYLVYKGNDKKKCKKAYDEAYAKYQEDDKAWVNNVQPKIQELDSRRGEILDEAETAING